MSMMICRTDPRVKAEHQRKEKARYKYSDNRQDGTSSKSCLVIPGINNHKKPPSRRKAGWHGAMSSQDSTASDNSNSEYHRSGNSSRYENERKFLLNASNDITNDWYADDASVESQSPASERINLANVNPRPEISPLLTLPKPTDRSRQARMQRAMETGNSHAYFGETEPAGRRGQKARVLPQVPDIPAAGKTSVPVRNFDSNDSVFDGVVEFSEHSKNPNSGQSMISGLTSASPGPLMRGFQQNRPQNYRAPGYAAEARERMEMMRHNLAEIVQEDVTRQPPSPIHPTHDSRDNQSLAPSLATNSTTPSFRRSAPVDVDDSSFTDPVENVQGIHATAMEHVLRGEYDLALEAFQQVLQVYLLRHGKAHSLTASAYHNLGTVHSKRAGLQPQHTKEQQDSREQALLCFKAAARSARDAPGLGPTHPNVAVSLVRIGFMLLQTKQYKNAGITFMEALRIRKAHYGHNHSLVANLYNNLGVCHMHSQEFEKGRDFLQQALNIQRQLLNQDSSNTAMLELADTLCNVGGLMLEWVRKLGPNPQHVFDAEEAFGEALQIREGTLGEQHSLTNQVRALHEMARSTQITTKAGTSVSSRASSATSQTPNRSLSGRSSATTTVHANVRKIPSYPQYSTPIESSNQTPSTPVSRHASNLSSGTRRADLSPFSRAAKGAFDPFKEGNDNDEVEESRRQQAQFGTSPFDGMPSSSGGVKPFAKDGELDLIETEENCLLASDIFGQPVTLTSYAQNAASQVASTQKQNDRSNLLSTTKTLLGRGGGNMDMQLNLSTSNTTPAGTMSSTFSWRELGLLPLAGDWPGSNNNRVTSVVLESPAKYLQTIHNCAVNFMKRNKGMEALHLLEIIDEVQRERNGSTHDHVASALYNLGICHLRMHSYYKAMQSFEEATRICHATQGRDSPLVAACLVKVGISLLQLKRSEDALWILREALSVREKSMGISHPLTAKVKNNIGCVHVELQQFELARDLFESALEAQRSLFLKNPNDGPTMFAIATSLQNLGTLHQKQGKTEYAVASLNEALQMKEKVLGPHHTDVLGTIDAIADAWLDSGNSTMALKYYKEHMNRLNSSHSTLEEVATLVKVSRVHLKRRDVVSQQKALQMAARIVKEDPSTKGSDERFELEKRIQQDMKTRPAGGGNHHQQHRNWV